MAAYRVLAGKHHVRQPDGKHKAYVPGDIVESEVDLVDRFNSKRPGFPKKFERVGEGDVDSPDETRRRPGESLTDFAARIAELAKQEAAGVKPEDQAASTNPSDVKMSPGIAEEQALREMSTAELTTLAAAEEVDLRGAKSKEAILKVLIPYFAASRSQG